MHFRSCFRLSYVSFTWTEWPTGIDGNKLPLCNKTAFKLVFDESINNLHSCGSWTMLRVDIIRPSTSQHATRSPSMKKNGRRAFWRSRNTEIFTPLSKKFHCCNLDPNNYALLFGSCKSLARSFSSLCVMRCGSEDDDGRKSGSCKYIASSVSVSVDSSSCCSSSDSSEKNSGGSGTGRPSPCGTGRKADGNVWILYCSLLILWQTFINCRYQAEITIAGIICPPFPDHGIDFLFRFSHWRRLVAHVLQQTCGAKLLSWSPILQPKYRFYPFSTMAVIVRFCDENVTSSQT